MIKAASRTTAALAALLLGACAAIQSTEEVVLDYNRAFANSRNEMLVMNVLRSAAREPMQFSTMGNVSGQIGNGTQLTIPFTNVIAGGRDIISPSIQITDAVNPQITIVPLTAKDFVTGILTPLATDDLQLFLHGAWDAEFLLPLIIGGVVCPDGRVIQNSGYYEGGEHNASNVFRRFFAESAATFRVESEAGPGEPRVLTLSDQETVALLRDGVGANYSIESIADARPGHKRVTIRAARRSVIAGLDIAKLCRDIPDPQPREAGAPARPPSLQGVGTPNNRGRVILRSVQTIIYFLGESHRVRVRPGTREVRGLTYLGPLDGRGQREEQILFRLRSGPSTEPHAVAVEFHGVRYYVPRLPLGQAENPERDRTLKTLSFLDQLIALQTSESSIRSTQPVLVTPQ